jgi:hypothetical protein
MAAAAWLHRSVRSGVFVALLAGTPILAASSSDLVPVRSGARLQSVAALTASGPGAGACLTPSVQAIRTERQRGSAAARRALVVFANDAALPAERIVSDVDGISVRFTTDRNAFDRVEAADDNGNGRPDVVDEGLWGAARAQQLLVGQLELVTPAGVDIVLARLGSGVEGISMPYAGRPGRTHVWLDPSLHPGGGSMRRAAEHQYAHAVAAALGLDPAWSEAFATWTVIAIEGSVDDRTLATLGNRLAQSGNGLAISDLESAGGNATWFAFLHEAYGPTAVKLAVEELGRGGSVQSALDRATRRATGNPLDAALRDYQLWTLLTGSRDDGKHFSFAARLPAPGFAATAEALPALSVQADPEIGPMGQAAILLRPDELGGGLTIRFEGDVAARWAADLLLVNANGSMQRVPVAIDADDSGELTLPVQDLREVVLLVRNLDADGRPARRYSWAAQFEPGFPAEFTAVHADPAGPNGGALVSWETATERGLLGFNVLRSRSDRGDQGRVNPVWIPAVGETGGPATYSFFDAGTEPGVAYRYRIEAVTLEGLISRSDAAVFTPAP